MINLLIIVILKFANWKSFLFWTPLFLVFVFHGSKLRNIGGCTLATRDEISVQTEMKILSSRF